MLTLTCAAQGTAVLGVENPPEASGVPCHLEISHAADPSYDESKKAEEKALQAPLLRQTKARAPHLSLNLTPVLVQRSVTPAVGV